MNKKWSKVPCEVVQTCANVHCGMFWSISIGCVQSILIYSKKQLKFQEISRIYFSPYEIKRHSYLRIDSDFEIKFKIKNSKVSNLGVSVIFHKSVALWSGSRILKSSWSTIVSIHFRTPYVRSECSIDQAYPGLFTPPNQNPSTMSIGRDNIFLIECPLVLWPLDPWPPIAWSCSSGLWI